MHSATTSHFVVSKGGSCSKEGNSSLVLSDLPSLDSEEMEQDDDDAVDRRLSPLNDDGTTILISPQTICSSRKLSLPVVTDPNATHRLLEGRQKIVLPLPPPPCCVVQTSSSTRTTTLSFANDPPPMRLDAWAPVPGPSFSVRGPEYLQQYQKNGGGGKVPSAPSLFSLLAVDMVRSNSPTVRSSGLCAHPQERFQRALAREQQLEQKNPTASSSSSSLPAFVFAVNLCIPVPASAAAAHGTRTTTPGRRRSRHRKQQNNSNDDDDNNSRPCSCCYHWVAYFGIDDRSLLQDDTTATGRLTRDFFFGSSDALRDQTLKLIPRVTEGNFVVRKAVGTKPSLLGTKLTHTYIRDTDHRYLEVLVDIGSDPVAHRIVQLALGYAKHLTVDMAFVLEAKCDEELPERVLGAVRVQQVDIHGGDGQRQVSDDGQ